MVDVKCSFSEMVDIDKLVPNPRNRNKHSEKQVKVLSKIIKNRGWRHPIIVSARSGFIVMGHGRLEAAKSLGVDSVPVDYQEFETEAEEYAVMIADNEIARYAEFDRESFLEDLGEDLSSVDFEDFGFIDFELPEVEVLPGENDDDVPKVKHDPVTKRGDVWLLGEHRVMCGDSTMINEWERLVRGEFVDLGLSDPPYGINIVNKKTGKVGAGDIAKNQKYREVIGDNSTETAKEYYHCVSTFVKDQVIFGGNYFTDFLPPTPCWFIWDKRGDMNSNDFADGEMAWVSKIMPVRIYKQIWNGMIREGESAKRVHPTQKPIALMEACIESIKKDAKTVVDGFLGSGSTLIACEKTKRKCYGMELDEHYCDVVINRWQDFTGKDAILESNKQTYRELLNEKNR